MFPISHVYVLNRLVARKFGRNLDSRDAEQVMGSWLLDAIVNKEMRKDESFNAQAYFHNNSMYSPEDRLQAGVLIHVMSDNLANYNTLHHPSDKEGIEKKDGFLGRREKMIYVPYEDQVSKKDDLRRRILQCALDMLIVRDAKEEIRKYFCIATSLFSDKKMYDKIYNTLVDAIKRRMKKEPDQIHPPDSFVNNSLKNACDSYLKQSIENYSRGLEYMMCDWRRADAARDFAGEEYCRKVSLVDLIRSNFIVLQGWKRDIDTAVGRIINDEPGMFQSFSRQI
ncbi:MAG: hypothetical protein QW666_03065 [Candidatus Woesearchaeota archaeon]